MRRIHSLATTWLEGAARHLGLRRTEAVILLRIEKYGPTR